jgi:ATP-dependent DNA ligase
MRTEDHPIEYGDFEGVIPPKQYGASTVLLWDHGTWHPIEDAKAGFASRTAALRNWDLLLVAGNYSWSAHVSDDVCGGQFSRSGARSEAGMDTLAVPTGSYWKGKKGQKK